MTSKIDRTSTSKPTINKSAFKMNETIKEINKDLEVIAQIGTPKHLKLIYYYSMHIKYELLKKQI